MKDYVQASRAHFNRQAAQYDQNTSVYYSGPAKCSGEDAIRELLAHSYQTLLDVGCGTGWLLNRLARVHPAEYHGLDVSENMLAVAEEKHIPGAVFVQGVADRLPYADNFFDVVTCIQSFHHYPDPDRAMGEALRVLKPGGLYLLSDTGVGGLAGWIDNHILFRLLNSGDCHVENRRGIARRMVKNGFVDVQSRQLKGFIYTVTGRKPA
ncbi:MAG TPA: class I SAM-dependent methyltransferase [Candidatus Evtepia faecigallinarum]|nr:class I SAM-dependent methyltransferase [Candidatus Evtepia faecigallinarum]